MPCGRLRGGDAAEVRILDIRVRVSAARAVQSIKCICPERERARLAEAKCLLQSDIFIGVSGPQNVREDRGNVPNAQCNVVIRGIGNVSKGSRVQIQRPGIVRGINETLLIQLHRGSRIVGAAGRKDPVRDKAIRDRQRVSGLIDAIPRNLPAAHCPIERSMEIYQFSRPERKLVDGR